MQNKQESSIIYPHVVLTNAEHVNVHDIYKTLFDKSEFYIFMSIYSMELNKFFHIDITIEDSVNGTSVFNKQYETLENNLEYEKFMSSIFCIFKPFKRNILNFDKNKSMDSNEFFEITKNLLNSNNK